MLEPWKVMLALAVLLAIIGAFTHLGISGPGQMAGALVLGTFFLVTTYLGYRIGKRLSDTDAG